MNHKKASIILILFAMLLLSCGPFTLAPANTGSSDNSSNGDIQQQINQAMAGTHLVETQIALSIQQTLAAQGGLNPPAITLTSTSTTVKVTVSTATFCRMGPTEDYPLIGTLYVGQTAEVIGRNAYGDSVVIRLPEMTSSTCWLWTAYATFTGNKDGLPIMTPPPVPATVTPTIPVKVPLCILNNSGYTINFIRITDPGAPWGNDWLGVGNTLSSGESFCVFIAPGIYDIRVEVDWDVSLKTWYRVNVTSNIQLVVP
jgi:hypothetical protein